LNHEPSGIINPPPHVATDADIPISLPLSGTADMADMVRDLALG
jgi:hypothetical protein